MSDIKPLRIVLFGCQKLAIDVLDFIHRGKGSKDIVDGDRIIRPTVAGVVCHDEDRDKLFCDQTVRGYCFEHDLLAARFYDKVNIDIIKQWNPDIIFSIYYRKIIPKEVIDLPPMGCINLHPAKLPKDRGPNPTLWVVKRGDRTAYSTLHYVDEGMDTGDIIASKGTDISGLTGFEVNSRMMAVGLHLFKEYYMGIMKGGNKRFKQSNKDATCNVAFTNNMRYVDWNSTAESIINHVRAFAKPYAGSIARTKKGMEILIHKAVCADMERSSDGPGTYVATENGLLVQTHDKPILLLDVENGNGLKRGRFVIGVPE